MLVEPSLLFWADEGNCKYIKSEPKGKCNKRLKLRFRQLCRALMVRGWT